MSRCRTRCTVPIVFAIFFLIPGLLCATAPSPAAALTPRITFTGVLPGGWVIEGGPSEHPEYVGFRATKLIRSSGGLIIAQAHVTSQHQWWQNWGAAEDYVYRATTTDAWGDLYWQESGLVTIDGGTFGYQAKETTPAEPDLSNPATTAREYYNPLPDGSAIEISLGASANTSDGHALLLAEAEQVFSGFHYDFTPWETSTTIQSGGETKQAEEMPWKTVAGGAAAVAAAAAAIVGSAASMRGRRRKLDPNEEVGYVLDLSTNRLNLSTSQPTALSATAWRVLASGQVEPATEAQISLRPPPGVAVNPAAGVASLQAWVQQDGDPPSGTALLVQAIASKGRTEARVELVPEGASELLLTLEPAGATLKPTGSDVVMVAAHLKLSLTAQVDPAVSFETSRASISFEQPSSADWLDVGLARDTGDGKDLPVSMSTPDPNSRLAPPESVTVRATATVGGEVLRGNISIPVQRPPSIDARPDTVQMSVGSGERVDVLVWIEDPGGLKWNFSTRWGENQRPLTRVDLTREADSSAVFSLTEDSMRLPDLGRAEEASRLIVTGSADGWDPLESYVNVIVTREGLFVDPTDRDPDGTFHIEARGEGKPSNIDLRVYVRGEDGKIALSPELSASVEWSPGGEETSAGKTVLDMPEFTCAFSGMRTIQPPSATYRLALARRLPTAAEPLPAVMQFSAPGHDEPGFTRQVALKFLGVDMSPYSPAWKAEYEHCMQIIQDYAPYDLQARFRALVNERGRLMGAEGLYEMRRRIWSISENALRKEAADYLTKAWYYEQVESVLDWISWCGDIAFAVASGRILGTAAGIAVGLLKPVLVSAMTAYVDGKDIWWWAAEQVKIGIGVVEGQWTDPDFLEKISGAGKAKVWAVFIAYTFVKNWSLDPEHRITEAMLNTMRMLRDQALISFLRLVAGTSPVPVVKPGSTTPAAAPKPASTAPAKPGPPKPAPAKPAPAKPAPTKPGGTKPGPETSEAGDATKPPAGAKPKPAEGAEPEPTKPSPEDAPTSAGKPRTPSAGKNMLPEPGESSSSATQKIAAAQKGHPNEVGTISKNGKVIHTQEGTADKVDWPKELLEGADALHSHPTQVETVTIPVKGKPPLVLEGIKKPGGAPSAADIGHAIEFKQKSQAVIGEDGAGQQTKFTVEIDNAAIDKSGLNRTELSGKMMSDHKEIVKKLNGTIDKQISDAVRGGFGPDFVKRLVQKKADMQRQIYQEALTQIAENPEYSGYIEVTTETVA